MCFSALPAPRSGGLLRSQARRSDIPSAADSCGVTRPAARVQPHDNNSTSKRHLQYFVPNVAAVTGKYVIRAAMPLSSERPLHFFKVFYVYSFTVTARSLRFIYDYCAQTWTLRYWQQQLSPAIEFYSFYVNGTSRIRNVIRNGVN